MSKYNHKMVVVYILWIENRNIYYYAIKMAAKQVWAHNALWLTMTL
jgi:hypothetical protein